MKGERNMTFSEKLITLRAGRGWSQERLAKEIGVTRQAVGRWERGECLPDAVGLTGLARAFDIDSEWLLDDNAAGTPEPRAARRVKLAWFDWLMLSLAAASLIAMLCGLNMKSAGAILGVTYRYPKWTVLAVLARGLVWFGGGWAAVALVCSFFARPLPLKRPLKIALVILGAAVAILYLTCVFIAYAATLGIYLDVPVLTPFAVSDRPELLLLPAALFALAAKRKAK